MKYGVLVHTIVYSPITNVADGLKLSQTHTYQACQGNPEVSLSEI